MTNSKYLQLLLDLELADSLKRYGFSEDNKFEKSLRKYSICSRCKQLTEIVGADDSVELRLGLELGISAGMHMIVSSLVVA